MRRVSGVLMVLGTAAASGCAARPPASVSSRDAAALAVEDHVVLLAAQPTRAAVQVPARPGDPFLADNRVIAQVNGDSITMGQFLRPLMESHGLPLLLNIVQLDLARQGAREEHVAVTPDDIRREQDLTLGKMFTDADRKERDQLEDAERKGQADRARQLREQIHKDRETLLAEYLQNQHYSRSEYDIVIEMNAYLRKTAEPLVRGRITDDMVEKEFGVEYGETAKVQYIQLANLEEVAEARRRLQAGQDFGDVAQQMSRNPQTAARKGEMAPFSRQTPGLPDTFKNMAFALQPGQVSDTLNVGGNYYLIKLEQKFAPKAVKFDSVKDALRQSMYDRLTESAMQELRARLGLKAMQTLKIDEPLLARQFDELKARQEAAIRDRQKMNEQWLKEREQAQGAAAATQPGAAGPPAGANLPGPLAAPANATRPAASH